MQRLFKKSKTVFIEKIYIDNKYIQRKQNIVTSIVNVTMEKRTMKKVDGRNNRKHEKKIQINGFQPSSWQL